MASNLRWVLLGLALLAATGAVTGAAAPAPDVGAAQPALPPHCPFIDIGPSPPFITFHWACL